jgi:hypothetical protein
VVVAEDSAGGGLAAVGVNVANRVVIEGQLDRPADLARDLWNRSKASERDCIRLRSRGEKKTATGGWQEVKGNLKTRDGRSGAVGYENGDPIPDEGTDEPQPQPPK